MDDIFNTPQNNDSENRSEAPPKANENNAPYNSPISSSAYESYQPKPQQNNSYNGTPYGAPQGAYSQRPEPPRYNNQENNRYGNGPQFNPSYSQMGYYPPKSQKKNTTGKKVFAVLICICIVVASIAIGSAFADDDTAKKPSTQQNDKTDDSTISGANPNVEDSPVTFDEYSGKGQMTPEQIYESVKDVNVGVIVYSQNQKVGEGSGIIVGEDDTNTYTYIITAAHVISDSGVSVQVQFNDKTEIDAKIVGFDTKTDIGVLRVEKTGFKAATFGNSDNLKVGQSVYAIGNPGGTVFFGSFTPGMVSAIDRPISTSASAYDLPCIQHTAAINPGNSGGALVNEFGQVIGLNSSKISSTEYEGMGFSVPSNTMLEIYTEIVANGYVTNRPMLGISYYTVASDYTYSAIAWQNNLPYGSIVIAAIAENNDLVNNGVQVGDIITGVNGTPLDSTDILLEVIENAKVGDSITLTICRLDNSGRVANKFDATVKLVEDKGETIITQQQQQQQQQQENPFSNYFEHYFGY